MVIESMFVYNFIDPNLRVEIFFEKEGAVENGGLDFEIGGYRLLCTLVLAVEGNFMNSLYAFF